MECKHENFQSHVMVNRLTDDDGNITNFHADVKIICAECCMPFVFKGMAIGLSPHKPMMSLDGEEARLPIEPAREFMQIPSKMPSFSLRLGMDN